MKIFYTCLLIVLALLPGNWAIADTPARPCHLCNLYEHARPRAPHPTKKRIHCVNFTLPTIGASVSVVVSRYGKVVIEDSKEVPTREAQFCYPEDMWLRGGGEPNSVYFCSEHHVTVHDEKLPLILSGRGSKPRGYACLRGVEGCGGENNSVMMGDQLDQ